MWDSLPPEVLGLVFSYCDMETVRRAEGVCQGWSRAVVATAWRKTILKWCRRDEHAAEWVREWRRAHGESYQSERLLYGRLVEGAWERGWRQGWAQRRARPDAVIHMCYVGEAFEEFKVSDAACRGGSLFLARRSGAVERWRLGEGGKEKEVVDVESREVIAHGGDYKNPDVKVWASQIHFPVRFLFHVLFAGWNVQALSLRSHSSLLSLHSGEDSHLRRGQEENGRHLRPPFEGGRPRHQRSEHQRGHLRFEAHLT